MNLPLKKWKAKHAISWLQAQGYELLVQPFRQACVDGQTMIDMLSDDALFLDIVANPGARRKIAKRIRALIDTLPLQ